MFRLRVSVGGDVDIEMMIFMGNDFQYLRLTQGNCS